MKRTIITIVSIISFVSFVACQKNEMGENGNGNSNQSNGIVFTAGLEDVAESKTTIDGLKVKWEGEGVDKINVNGVDYTAHPSGTDATKAMFTKDNEQQNDPQPTFNAIYPSSIYVASPSAHFELPANMTYAAGKFNVPMYAESENNILSFKNIFAVLKISIPNSIQVKSVAVSSDLFLNGTFTIESNVAKITEGENATKITTLTCNGTVEGTDFYIPIPAGTYTGKHLKVVLTKGDDSTETMTTSQNATITVVANKMYGINFKKDGLFILGPTEKTIEHLVDVL